MYIHIGQQNYGKVDVVPGLCYVATRFFTINLVQAPTIPTRATRPRAARVLALAALLGLAAGAALAMLPGRSR